MSDELDEKFCQDIIESAERTRAALKSLHPRSAGDDAPKLRKSVRVEGEKLVAIASSTGGPKALHKLIPFLPKNLNAPVVLVQHMPTGFTKSLAERLDIESEIEVTEAVDGEKLKKGHVYIAAGGKHMKLARADGGCRVYYTDEPPREGVKPCANYMFESISDLPYAQICCVVLTGMGADATEGIVNLEKSRALHVIAQNEETCAVYGMPKSITATGLVNELLPLENVANAIVNIVGES